MAGSKNGKGTAYRYDRDFLLGYVVHLLVDVYNSMYFYTPFIQSIKKDYEETIKKYKDESYGMTYYLFSKYSEKKDLSQILHNGEAVTLEGVIDQEDIIKVYSIITKKDVTKVLCK